MPRQTTSDTPMTHTHSSSLPLSKRWRALLARVTSRVGHYTSNFTHELHNSKSSSLCSVESILSPSIPGSSSHDSNPTLESILSEYLATTCASPPFDDESEKDAIDQLRASDYTRLNDQVYVDYMGGCLFPESLVRAHADFLQTHLMGNTHSDSPSSSNSSIYVAEARKATLDFFDAPEEDYTVVFTSSTTHALKLIAESYPFTPKNSLLIPVDAHNSVHGMRCFAHKSGSEVCYLNTTPCGGVDIEKTKKLLSSNHHSTSTPPSLLVLTGLSNITNSKTPLSLATYAKQTGYNVVLDAAALAPTSRISLRTLDAQSKGKGIDAMAISFYKMFGYPTGVGALIAKKKFLSWLSGGERGGNKNIENKNKRMKGSNGGGSKVWFAGGTVDVVQVPGEIFTLSPELHERFEEGTINYLSFPAIVNGIRLLDPLLDILSSRLENLVRYLVASLSNLRNETGIQYVKVLSRTPFHADQQREIDHSGELIGTGSVISVIFLDEQNSILPLSLISHLAAKSSISLRTGCMCNPGGASAMLGLFPYMSSLSSGTTLKELENRVGRELGVVRISLGLVSGWDDVRRLLDFCRDVVGVKEEREKMSEGWRMTKQENDCES